MIAGRGLKRAPGVRGPAGAATQQERTGEMSHLAGDANKRIFGSDRQW